MVGLEYPVIASSPNVNYQLLEGSIIKEIIKTATDLNINLYFTFLG